MQQFKTRALTSGKVTLQRVEWKTAFQLRKILGKAGALRHCELMKKKGKAKQDAWVEGLNFTGSRD